MIWCHLTVTNCPGRMLHCKKCFQFQINREGKKGVERKGWFALIFGYREQRLKIRLQITPFWNFFCVRNSKDFAERLNFCRLCTPLHVFYQVVEKFLIGPNDCFEIFKSRNHRSGGSKKVCQLCINFSKLQFVIYLRHICRKKNTSWPL